MNDVSQRRRGRGYIALAALAWSSAGFVQRGIHADGVTQVVGRAFFACLGIAAFVVASERGRVRAAFREVGLVGLGFAACTAVSSAAFILALNVTTVANVLVLQATAPLLAAALGWLFLGEHVASGTWAAALVAVAGVAIMVGGPGGSISLGLLLASVTSVAFAAAIVLARARPDVSMTPASCLGQLVVALCLLPMAHTAQLGPRDIGLLCALGVGQIGLGFVFLTLGARLIPAAEVALLSLLEVVLGPVWVFLSIREVPSPATLVGGAVIVVAVLIGTQLASASGARQLASP